MNQHETTIQPVLNELGLNSHVETNSTPMKNKNSPESRKWIQTGESIYLRFIQAEYSQLENAVYQLRIDQLGEFYLVKLQDKFDFDYKLYGLEEKLINRAIKTYNNTTGNLGILLNGLKGTGKTVTSKQIANKLEMPVIIIDIAYDGCHTYLNRIPQDICVFIDEYEKVFKESSDLLTIMDGVFSSEQRRAFILTTNELYVNQNLLQRPGRIRYTKTFRDLAPEVIDEIIEDCLKDKTIKEELVKFIASLEVITVDVVKSLCQEVNIHGDLPEDFADIFNVKRITGKYNIYKVDEDGKREEDYSKNAKISPRSFDSDDVVGYGFTVAGKYIGRITEVISDKVIKVHIEEKPNLQVPDNMTEEEENKWYDEIERLTKRYDQVFRIEHAYMTHHTFGWSAAF